jgi:adenosylcobinamide-phosphate synthase
MLIVDVLIAYILDLLFGDPYWMPHPVRFIGWLIKNVERILRKAVTCIPGYNESNRVFREKAAGFVLAVVVISLTFFLVFIILKAAALINPVLFHIVNIYIIYSSFAGRCLADEANKVYEVLKTGDIAESRKRLSMLVGRQTENLDEKEVVRGVVETTAENTVDGVMSPLIYALIGSIAGLGAPLTYVFKAASTLDSMVGYMNEKYINFGYASAKFDDILNYLPARLSGIIIPVSALICGKSFKRSFRIMLRDRKKHKSPNCAYPEAAVAGALGIRIGGTNVYFGRTVEKPAIGDAVKELEVRDIKDTIKIMYAASLLTLIVFTAVAWLAVYMMRG